MNTDEITGTKYLEHGDVVTINGKKYLCEEQSPDHSNCRYCAFIGYKCLLPKELNYECSSNWVALTKIEDVIQREQIEIENTDGDDAINVNMSTIGGKIYYVHELQHAITMCKINLKLK